jgi:uncharacterized protein YuzE
MRELYLEVTFRHGRAMAAYLYLPRQAEEKSVRTRHVEPGMVVDFGASGNPIGIEITAPEQVSLSSINQILQDLGLPPVTGEDLAPLLAA